MTPVPAAPRRSRKKSRKSFFLRGLVTLLPAVLTIVLFGLVLQVADQYVNRPINQAIYWTLESNGLGWKVLARLGIDPTAVQYIDVEELQPDLQDKLRTWGSKDERFLRDLEQMRSDRESFFRDHKRLAIDSNRLRASVNKVVPPIIGVLLSILLVLFLGYLASGFLGRRMIAAFDKTLHSIPLVRSVYPYTKQLVEFFLSENDLEFDSVVAVPYPSDGLWSIGLVTGNGLRSIVDHTGTPILSVFMPTSPMPMTGYTVFIQADRVVPLDVTVDEALRITVSGGVLVPPSERTEDLQARFQHLLQGNEEQRMAQGASHSDPAAAHPAAQPPAQPPAQPAEQPATPASGPEAPRPGLRPGGGSAPVGPGEKRA